jgi:hypothetical protein
MKVITWIICKPDWWATAADLHDVNVKVVVLFAAPGKSKEVAIRRKGRIVLKPRKLVSVVIFIGGKVGGESWRGQLREAAKVATATISPAIITAPAVLWRLIFSKRLSSSLRLCKSRDMSLAD